MESGQLEQMDSDQIIQEATTVELSIQRQGLQHIRQKEIQVRTELQIREHQLLVTEIAITIQEAQEQAHTTVELLRGAVHRTIVELHREAVHRIIVEVPDLQALQVHIQVEVVVLTQEEVVAVHQAVVGLVVVQVQVQVQDDKT